MFAYIIGLIREFERKHGRRPQVICLNPIHMQLFMEECPDLFNQETAMPLGFRIMILPESELPHPKAVWLPRPRQDRRRAALPKKTDVIPWTKRNAGA